MNSNNKESFKKQENLNREQLRDRIIEFLETEEKSIFSKNKPFDINHLSKRSYFTIKIGQTILKIKDLKGCETYYFYIIDNVPESVRILARPHLNFQEN